MGESGCPLFLLVVPLSAPVLAEEDARDGIFVCESPVALLCCRKQLRVSVLLVLPSRPSENSGHKGTKQLSFKLEEAVVGSLIDPRHVSYPCTAEDSNHQLLTTGAIKVPPASPLTSAVTTSPYSLVCLQIHFHAGEQEKNF